MARYFTLRLYFHSPLAHENKLACSVKYFAISHSDSCNKYYIYIYIYMCLPLEATQKRKHLHGRKKFGRKDFGIMLGIEKERQRATDTEWERHS